MTLDAPFHLCYLEVQSLPIELLGHLDDESIERLKDLLVILSNLAPNENEKKRLEDKQKDPTWTGAPPLTTSTTATNDNNYPSPGPATAPTSSASRPAEGRTRQPYGSSWAAESSHHSGGRQSTNANWRNLGRTRPDAASESQESQPEEGGGGDSRGSDDPPGSGRPPRFRQTECGWGPARDQLKRGRRPWRPVLDK